ncbi:MAG: Tm-1-like ATP-binding domain-containing protein [Bacillota bacterium]
MKVLLFGTLDSKLQEVDFLREALVQNGLEPLIVDASCLKNVGVSWANVSPEEVARKAGTEFPKVASLPRGEALEVMATGVGAIAAELVKDKVVAGVIALGGANGTLLASRVMRRLPRGLPKVLVSAAAAVNLRDVVGTTDMVVVNTVCDASLNEFTKGVFASAAAALAGMMRGWMPACRVVKGTVCMSMLGLTQGLVERCKAALEERGYDVLGFHANGYGGRALEETVRQGGVSAVLDVTLNEVMNNLVGGVFDAGPDRLEAAISGGVPLVLAPGACDFVNFWGEAVPPKYQGRRLWRHNVQNTLMRTTPEENLVCGRVVGEKLNKCTARTVMLVPMGGFSGLDKPGGPEGWFDPSCQQAFWRGVSETVHNPQVICRQVQSHVNSDEFSAEVLRELLYLLEGNM